MGQFSWFTQDTDVPIYNDWDRYPQDRQTVHMVDPRNGADYKEDGYEGYGVFGGRDFYELFADINKDIIKNDIPEFIRDKEHYDELMSKPYKDLDEKELDQKRLLGITVWFYYVERYEIPVRELPQNVKILSPILVENYKNWEGYVGYTPETDPNQGWHSYECETSEGDYNVYH